MNFLTKLLILTARADSPTTNLPNPLGDSATVETVLNRIISQVITYAAIVVSIVIILAAFQMLFAQGSPEKFKTGRNAIVYAIIGFIVILLASGVAKIVESALKVT